MVSGTCTQPTSDDAWRPPASAPADDEQIDGFTDLALVGRGGDSVVYRARQVSVDREVAIKVLDLDSAGDPERAARFAREVQITVDLGRQHPNIVTVLATGTTASGRPAIVMDFHDGGTLHDRLRAHGPLPPEEVGRIGEVLADALSFAHGRGVLHRDVKPQNVLLLPTSWVLTDFGIARLADSDHTSSAERFTYRHASPQILDGQRPTASDDIWSLGSTLYTLLDGRPPFASDDPDDDSALSYLRRARTEPNRPLHVPGAERLSAIIDRCLRKDVADRWATAAELRDALHALRGSAWEPGGAPAAAAERAPAPVPPLLAKSPAPAPTPAPAPAPRRLEHAEPAPLAVSAVSHVVRATDADPTGTGLPDHTGSSPAAPVPPAAAPAVADDEPPRRRRLPVLLGAAALTLGLVIGLIAAVLRGGQGDDGGPQREVSQQSAAGTVLQEPPADAPAFRDRPSRDLSVVFTDVAYDGVTMHLEWTDPAEAEGEFYLLRLDPQNPQGLPVAQMAPGQTSADLEISLPLGKSCYYIAVFKVTGEYGVSKRRCLEYPTNNTLG
ncbi:hypothetical protein GCM10023340_38080 [Nocardioides marinquilinus]|uniref:non-specific serine/threonine protein kinase n=1 Tax=Nocardioides marinquilinus TaxID=1210400 RepID=A0ABP9PZE6_9ACTN